ncbi:MAG: D-alanyl-D-alanine carboxypeptidase [Rhodomicrobiaceae bacterium]
MVVSIGISTDHRELGLRRAWLSGLFRLVLFLILAVALAAAPADAKKRPLKRSHYAPPQSAVVIDGYSGKILYQENPDKPRFPASITKVMTLYLLFEQIHAGRLSLDTEMKVSAAAADHPPSKLGLEAGGTISVRDAMYALVTKSANDVAAVVAETIAGSEDAFARMMTHKAHEIGMTNTNFYNASGLPNQAQTTTARDLVTLGRRMLTDFPQDAKIFRTRYFQYGDARFKNHNGLLFSYEGIDGMKTGFTQASGFNLLVSCHRDDKHLIAVVLGGRSSGERNAKMRTLLDQAWRKAVALNDLKQRGTDRPVAITEALQDDDMMPERNPAFHSTASERVLEAALASANAGGREDRTEKPAQPSMAAATLAGGRPGLQSGAQNQGEEDEDHAEEQGDTDANVASNDGAALGPYHVQVGSYLDIGSAKARLVEVTEKAAGLLKGHGDLTVTGEVHGKSYYRARFGQFSEKDAASTCTKLKRLSIECLAVRAE